MVHATFNQTEDEGTELSEVRSMTMVAAKRMWARTWTTTTLRRACLAGAIARASRDQLGLRFLGPYSTLFVRH